MSERKKISTTAAPAAIGPYSQAIVAGGLVHCSGQIGSIRRRALVPRRFRAGRARLREPGAVPPRRGALRARREVHRLLKNMSDSRR
jgi:hypothetical protein